MKLQNLYLLPLLMLLLFQGCTLKEAYQTPTPQAPAAMKPKPAPAKPIATKPAPQTKPIMISKPEQPKMIVVPPTKQAIKAAFSHPKTMKFPTLDGKIITIKGDANLLYITNPEYQGKDIVLFLFGRDCPHCQNETAQIRRLAQKPNIKIIGIHAHKMIGNKALKAYARKIGYNFDILSFDNDVQILKYLDHSGIWGGGTPSHLLIDSGGNVQDMRLTDLLNR
jgi:peroxiredoxin